MKKKTVEKVVSCDGKRLIFTGTSSIIYLNKKQNNDRSNTINKENHIKRAL